MADNVIERVGLVGVAALAVGAALVGRRAARPPRRMGRGGRSIGVNGRGTAKIAPDVAVVQLGVRVEAATAQAATSRAAEALNRMLTVVRDAGVADRDIQTGYVNISPQYRYEDGQQRRVGNEATNTVQVRVTPLAKTGAILDAIVAAGGDAVTVNGVQLEANDPSATRAEAQRLALLDARDQAERMAGVLGVRVGEVLNIGETSENRPTPIMRGARMMAMRAPADMPTPIEAGELTITANVAVIFAIA